MDEAQEVSINFVFKDRATARAIALAQGGDSPENVLATYVHEAGPLPVVVYSDSIIRLKLFTYKEYYDNTVNLVYGGLGTIYIKSKRFTYKRAVEFSKYWQIPIYLEQTWPKPKDMSVAVLACIFNDACLFDPHAKFLPYMDSTFGFRVYYHNYLCNCIYENGVGQKIVPWCYDFLNDTNVFVYMMFEFLRDTGLYKKFAVIGNSIYANRSVDNRLVDWSMRVINPNKT